MTLRLFTHKRDAGSQQQNPDQKVLKLLSNQLPDTLTWQIQRHMEERIHSSKSFNHEEKIWIHSTELPNESMLMCSGWFLQCWCICLNWSLSAKMIKWKASMHSVFLLSSSVSVARQIVDVINLDVQLQVGLYESMGITKYSARHFAIKMLRACL